MEIGTAGWNTQPPRCRLPHGGGRARQRAVRKAAVLVAFLAACCVLSRIKTLAPESYTSSYLAGRRLLGAVAEADVDVSQPEPDVDPGPPRYARLKRAPPDSGHEGDPDGAEPRAKPTGGDKGKTRGKSGGGGDGGEKPTNATKGNGKAGPEGTVQVDSAGDAADKDGKPEPKQPSGQEAPKGGGTGDENPEKKPPGRGEGKPAKPDKNSEESPPKGEAVGSADDVGRKEEGKPKQGEPEGRPEEPETKPESTEAKPKEEGKEPAANAEREPKPGGEPDGGAKPGKDTNGEPKPKEQDEEAAEPKEREPGEETADGKEEPKNDDSSGDGKKTEPGPNVEVAPKNGSNSNATKTPQGKEKKGNDTANDGEAVDCIRPAYHEFPPDLFSHDARAKGGVIVHILVVLYMFYALAVVCDDYFIASLEECCARLNLSQDVAGATFMAAGSSAPELFTAILGVLVAKGDVGTGTIVGSAVFNVLFVIGLCGLCSGKEVPVTWWPLFRDSIFYAFTVVILILVIYDGEVTWYDSLFMLLLYGVYIDIMKYNNRIHHWVGTTFGIHEEEQTSLSLTAAACDGKNYSSYVPFNNEIDDYAQPRSLRPPLDEVIRDSRRRPSLYEAALRMLMTRYFRPKTRFWAAAKRITHEYKRIQRGEIQHLPSQTSLDPNDMVRRGKSSRLGTRGAGAAVAAAAPAALGASVVSGFGAGVSLPSCVSVCMVAISLLRDITDELNPGHAGNTSFLLRP